MCKARRQLGRCLGWMLALAPFAVPGAELQVVVQDDAGPIAGAVVELIAVAGEAPTPAAAVMDQINSEFVPRQLVVTRGSAVSFPNSDSTRHQVYSFSPAKRFELPLYSGTPPDPVVFDSAGVVALGCNIHDAMIGFIVVVDTDRHATTGAEGRVRFSDVPEGEYRLRVWHERIAGERPEQRFLVAAKAKLDKRFELQLGPPPPPRGDARLRALQERFRALKRDPR